MTSRVPALVAIGALLMLAAVATAGGSAVPAGEGEKLFSFFGFPTIELPEPPEPESGSVEPNEWGGWLARALLLMPVLLLVLSVVLTIALAVLRWRRFRLPVPGRTDRESTGFAVDPGPNRLLDAARAAQAELIRHYGGPPRDAVIAAWVRLEEAAEDTGTPRRPHQTPTEFTAALGAETAALDELRRLYHRARFAPGYPVTQADAEAARAALDEIVRTLTPEPVA
ncbi:MAG TPA: DUF4129 domain-containing protein [Actinophytocola sp.]|uniref:DUF4129 domain-containing protein n=1 Tax=Actinophytocola sp. TaxID=1872138 RepID=UPI002DBB40EF|nr:DUF4129 domain-containing protein [Actinophytocola sp.]HEU5469952.1 DUF4129 domain-containing protein [Actinophytocola sp.]